MLRQAIGQVALLFPVLVALVIEFVLPHCADPTLFFPDRRLQRFVQRSEAGRIIVLESAKLRRRNRRDLFQYFEHRSLQFCVLRTLFSSHQPTPALH